MSTKNIDARIKNKRDTAANWEKNNPVLLNGEKIIVDTNAGEVREKIGDGIKTYSQLPFTDEAIKAQIDTKLTTPTGTQGQYLGFTANNIIGAVNAPSCGAFSHSFSGTLSTTWSGTSSPYYQQFSIADMTDTICPLVFPQWSANPPSDAQKTAWNTIEGSIESFNRYVRFYTNTKTTTAVNFILYY